MKLLYDTYGEALYGVIFRLVDNKSVAEKVFCDTFERVFNDIESYRPELSSFFTWIMNISRSFAKDHTFTYRETIEDKKDEDIFDLIVNKGSSIQTIADLFSIGKTECAIKLRTELKKIRTN